MDPRPSTRHSREPGNPETPREPWGFALAGVANGFGFAVCNHLIYMTSFRARHLTIQADHVVIDCPPHIGPATLAATGIADMVLIPVTPSGADLVATDSALALVHDAQVARKDGGPLCLLVPSKVDRRTAVGRELAAALERFGEPVGPEIGQRAALVDAFAVGAWIGQYAPHSEARGHFRDLATAVKRRWLMELRRLRSGGDDQRQKNIGAGVEFKVA